MTKLIIMYILMGMILNETFFGMRQYDVIREICEENGIKIGKEDCSTISLLEKLSLGLTKKENIKDENDLFEAEKFILTPTSLFKFS